LELGYIVLIIKADMTQVWIGRCKKEEGTLDKNIIKLILGDAEIRGFKYLIFVFVLRWTLI